MNPLHKAARDYASRGIPVFPCVPGRKEPASEHGFHDATVDLAQIDAWWAEADYNVAFSPAHAGLGIVDLDGKAARQSWEDLQIEHGYAADTWTVQTPRGEDYLHLYFKGTLPTSVSRLAKGIDTRGVGSYALLPPSVVNGGEYRVACEAEPTELPTWIISTLDKLRAKTAAQVGERDLPANIQRARLHVANAVKGGRVARKGSGADQITYDIACALMDLGLTQEMTFKLLWEDWGPHCDPGAPDPYFQAFLERKVENAASYAQNEAGAWAVPPAGEVFGSVLDKLDPKYLQPAARSRFYPYDEDEQDGMPEPTWIVPGYIPANSTVMIYGERETFKSFLALDLALSLAAGIEYGTREAQAGLPVVFVAGEGPRSVSRQRRPAWRLARSVAGPIPFHIVQTMPWLATDPPVHMEEFCAAIEERAIKPAVIILDTLARAMTGANENDAQDAGMLIATIEELKARFQCTVLVIHHSGHGQTSHSRGSSALEGGFDAVFRVEAERATRAVSLTCTKMKDADHPPALHWEMRQIGPSIVPFPIDKKAFKLLSPPEDGKAALRAISAALTKLGAVDPASAVATRVLAAEVLPASPDESPEEREENVGRVARALQAQASSSLAAYATRRGRDLAWSLSA